MLDRIDAAGGVNAYPYVLNSNESIGVKEEGYVMKEDYRNWERWRVEYKCSSVVWGIYTVFAGAFCLPLIVTGAVSVVGTLVMAINFAFSLGNLLCSAVEWKYSSQSHVISDKSTRLPLNVDCLGNLLYGVLSAFRMSEPRAMCIAGCVSAWANILSIGAYVIVVIALF